MLLQPLRLALCWLCDSPRTGCAQSFALWQQATIEFMRCNHWDIFACSRHIWLWCCFSCTSCSWWSTQSTQRQQRGCNNIPSFLQQTAPIACSFYEGFTQHDLHILVTAPFCCDRKARAACVQFRTVAASNNRVHATQSIYYCLLMPHICGVILREHPVCGESDNAMSTERLQQCVIQVHLWYGLSMSLMQNKSYHRYSWVCVNNFCEFFLLIEWDVITKCWKQEQFCFATLFSLSLWCNSKVRLFLKASIPKVKSVFSYMFILTCSIFNMSILTFVYMFNIFVCMFICVFRWFIQLTKQHQSRVLYWWSLIKSLDVCWWYLCALS